MNWEDTVMNSDDAYMITGSVSYSFLLPHLKAQAKLSFEAGKQSGIREVAGWINMHTVGITTDNDLEDDTQWREQLKKWGIEPTTYTDKLSSIRYTRVVDTRKIA